MYVMARFPFPRLDLVVRKTSMPKAELTLSSRFGFMIEGCIVAARQSQPMICPAHPDRPLAIKDIAPDLVRYSMGPH